MGGSEPAHHHLDPELYRRADQAAQFSGYRARLSYPSYPPINVLRIPAFMLYRFRWIPVLALILAGTLSGCDDTLIDPFDNEERYFTVYGYLDMLETRHTLRVVPITRFAENIETIDGESDIDAQVFTTDMVSGQRTQWQHKYTELDDGTFGHIFEAQFLVSANRTYKLEIVRSDGKTTTAETTVPVINSASLFEKGPVVFEQDSTLIYQDLRIPQITSPWEVNLIYLWGSGPINRRIFVPYGRPGQRTDNGWQMRINLSDDQQAVRENVQWSIDQGMIPNADEYGVSAMGVQIRMLDTNWDPPNGVFDPEVLAQPGVLSNVENGYGFFGSVGLYIEEWNIEALSPDLGHPF